MKKYLSLIAAMTFCTAAVSCSSQQASSTGKVTPQIVTSPESSNTDKKEETVITFPVMMFGNESYYNDLITPFNEADNGYRVELMNYLADAPQEGVDRESGIYIDFQLIQDIINDKGIDIISTGSFNSAANFELLKKRGAFVDLYDFMENDPDINKSTMNEHILKLNETDGKLYGLPIRYSVTTLCGKKEYVDDKENWSVDEFIDRYDRMPEGSTVNGSHNCENVYYDILRGNIESFVDYENAEANFDCEEFRKLLQFCKRFESNKGNKLPYDYESPVMLSTRYISGFADSAVFNDEMTLVGYPTLSGKGAYFTDAEGRYGISANSSPEKQQGAWEFIRYLSSTERLMETYCIEREERDLDTGKKYTAYEPEFGFPVNNIAFEQQMQEMIDGKKSYIIHGHKDDDAYDEESDGKPTNIADPEKCEKLKAYLDSIDRYEVQLDDSLWLTVNDEVMSYFADELSLDDCIDRIQNRISIMLSERCG